MCDIPGVKPPCPETGHCLAGTGHSTDLGSRCEVFLHPCKIGVTLRVDRCHVGPTCPLSEQCQLRWCPGDSDANLWKSGSGKLAWQRLLLQKVWVKGERQGFGFHCTLNDLRQAWHYHVKPLVEIFVNRQSKRIKEFFLNLWIKSTYHLLARNGYIQKLNHCLLLSGNWVKLSL